MKLKLIAPARKPEWGESFWELKTFVKLTGRKAAGTLLALPTLAALTPRGIDITITDENIEPIDFDEHVDLVGISFLTSLAPRAYEIADLFRRKNVKVVLGGIHASMLPEEAAQYADAVVIGEAEITWPRLIDDFRRGSLQKFYRAERSPNLENAPLPRWDLINTKAYCYFTVQTSRGCPYNCEFCSVHQFNGRKVRHRKVKDVVKEITFLRGLDSRKSIFFADDNFLADTNYALELIKALEPLNIRFWIQASLNKLDNSDLLKELYDSGCRSVFVGFESVSQTSIEYFNKKSVNKVERYCDIIRKIHHAGIWIFGSFIFGNDTDDLEIFEETAKFVQNSNIAFSMPNILTPLPGTRLFEKLQQDNRIESRNWQDYNCENLCIKLSKMDRAQFTKAYKILLGYLNTHDSIVSRLNNLWNMGVLIRESKKMVTKGRVLATINILKNNPRHWRYAVKDVWDRRNVSVMSIVMAVNCTEYYRAKMSEEY